MPRSTRSRSRGRAAAPKPVASPPTPKVKKAKKPAAPVEPDMQFDEGAAVMARWPGSSLFFKAKVQFVRDDDNEYDVEYENGTVYTIKAKDVYSQESSILKRNKSRARSRSRGRSPGRGRPTKKVEVDTTEAVSADETGEVTADEADKPADGDAPAEPEVKPVKPAKPAAEKVSKLKAETPTRVSARIAAKAVTDAYSDDESEKVKLAPNPELPDARGKRKGWNLEWVYALLLMVIAPTILVSLHTLCNAGCKLAMPTFSKDLATYVDLQSIGLVMVFGVLTDILSSLPVGQTVNGRRMNGFAGLVVLMAAVPALIYFKVPLGIVNEKYFTLMTSCIIMSFLCAVFAYIMAKWKGKYNLNSKGCTGNPIVDIFNGVELNPKHLMLDWKLQLFRSSMMMLAMLNVVMVADQIVKSQGAVSPQLVLAAAFQVVYAMDALYFEEYFSLSHDAMNTGYGWSLLNSYCCFPFLPTLTTRYLMNVSTPMAWYYLVGIGLVNALGYAIYRLSEKARCEFVKNPSNPALANLETLVAGGNKKLIVNSWWGLVRHPNYLGEILITWSWVLPAACSLGSTALVPYFLPVVTTLGFVIRSHQLNQKNKRKYGAVWTQYTEKVKSNIIPYVY